MLDIVSSIGFTPALVVRPQRLRPLDVVRLALLGAAVSKIINVAPSRPK
jgi:hypothetical protein